METIKLPNGPILDFYTVAEKKPSSGEQVVFIVNCVNPGISSIIRGYYRTFNNVPGRFVSETHGSHKESTVIFWTPAYPKEK